MSFSPDFNRDALTAATLSEETMPQAASPMGEGDATLVEKLVLEYSNANALFALEVTKQNVSERIIACDAAYQGRQKMVNPSEAAEDLGYKVQVQELADQCDAATALDVDLLLGNDIYSAIAINGEQQDRVDITKDVVDSELNYKNQQSEIISFASHLEKYPYAVLKPFRSTEYKTTTNRYEVPGEAYSDNTLMQRGFLQPGMNPSVAFNAATTFDERGKLLGMNQEEPKPVDDSMPLPPMGMEPPKPLPSLMFEKKDSENRDCYYYKAVHPRMLTWSDFNRKGQNQFTVHEYHFLSKNEIKSWTGVQNIDKLGDANSGGKNAPDGAEAATKNTPNGGTSQINPNFQTYEIIESWQPIPFEDWIDDGKIQIQDLEVFAQKWGCEVDDLIKSNLDKFCVYHKEGACLLRFYTNYLMDRTHFPYYLESAIWADDKLVGQGTMERIADPAAAEASIINLWLDCLRFKLYQPIAVSAKSDVSIDKLKNDFFKARGLLQTPGNMPIGDMLTFLNVDDNTQPAAFGINFFDNKISDLGTPPVLTGQADDKTATQTSINQRRGQTKVNSKLRRIHTNVIIPVIQEVWDMVVMNFTESRYVEVAGEDGTQISQRKWITPKQITDKVKLVAPSSFDYGQQQIESQLLLSLCNVFAPILPPPQMLAIMKLILEKNRIPRYDIAEIMNSVGSLTTVQDEIRAMTDDPNVEITVRIDDPHQMAIEMAMMEIQKFVQSGGQEGLNPMQKNVQDYIQKHNMLLQQQMMMQQQMAAAQGGPGSPKGPPNQIPGPQDQPHNDSGMSRRNGQSASPADGGMKSAAGMTGQGSPPKAPGEFR